MSPTRIHKNHGAQFAKPLSDDRRKLAQNKSAHTTPSFQLHFKSRHVAHPHSCQPTIIPNPDLPLRSGPWPAPGSSHPAFKQWSQPCSEQSPRLGKAPRAARLTWNGEHSRPQTGTQIYDKKKLAKGTLSKLFTCQRYSVYVSHMSYSKIRGPSRLRGTPSPMGEGNGSSQIEHCHRTYNLAYLSSNCPPPQGGHVLIRGEKGWALTQDACTHKIQLVQL